MKLKSIDYTQFDDTDRKWSLSGLTLGSVNLVVGKNATGKTRTLNLINGLGMLASGRKKPAELTTGRYQTTFEHDGRELHYTLEIKDKKVVTEEFKDGDRVLLQRGTGGAGIIYHEKEDKHFEFQTPETDAAVVARVDKIQHTFLEPLSEWGAGVRHYAFGQTMGQTVIAILMNDAPPPDPADVNAVIALFRKGVKDFPIRFPEAVKRDMNDIGYDIEDVGVMPPTDMVIVGPSPVSVSPLILYVKERDLPVVTQQTDMSTGMFRALAVIVHVNYAVIASRPSCILIDDIGEGLDFDRSLGLIKIIQRKTAESAVQLVMSTNDRFVMNGVPLESWAILQRTGGSVKVRNFENSKEIFDKFKFTGLNNFDFLRYDFIDENPETVFEGLGADMAG